MAESLEDYRLIRNVWWKKLWRTAFTWETVRKNDTRERRPTGSHRFLKPRITLVKWIRFSGQRKSKSITSLLKRHQPSKKAWRLPIEEEKNPRCIVCCIRLNIWTLVECPGGRCTYLLLCRLCAGQTIADIFFFWQPGFLLHPWFHSSSSHSSSSLPPSFLLIFPISCITSHRSDASDDLCAVRRLRGGVDCASFTLRHSRLVERLSPYLLFRNFFSLSLSLFFLTGRNRRHNKHLTW